MKSAHTWIVIADGGGARTLRRGAFAPGLSPVDGMTMAVELPRSSELGADRLGRGHESHGHARHAIEPRSDPHDKLEHEFLGRLVDELDTQLGRHAFDCLVLVALPRALGVLRAKLTDRLRAVVAAEIAKDLTRTPNTEIMAHLAGHLPI